MNPDQTEQSDLGSYCLQYKLPICKTIMALMRKQTPLFVHGRKRVNAL